MSIHPHLKRWGLLDKINKILYICGVKIKKICVGHQLKKKTEYAV